MTLRRQSFVTEEVVYAASKAVIDLELGINIVDLGLIFSVEGVVCPPGVKPGAAAHLLPICKM